MTFVHADAWFQLFTGTLLLLATLMMAVNSIQQQRAVKRGHVKHPVPNRIHFTGFAALAGGTGAGQVLNGLSRFGTTFLPPFIHGVGLLGIGLLQVAVGVHLFTYRRSVQTSMQAVNTVPRFMPVLVIMCGMLWIILSVLAL